MNPDDTSPIDPLGSAKIQMRNAKEAQETTYFGVVTQLEEIKLSYDFAVKPNANEGMYFVPLKQINGLKNNKIYQRERYK